MQFDVALKLMKEGQKVKLPSWGGFWAWDEEKQTILMHCRKQDSDTGKEILDIRETRRVEYTLRNIISGDWIVATEENTPLLGGEATFGFDAAIKYLKRGISVKRKGWNGKQQYIELAERISYTNQNAEIINPEHKDMGNRAIAFVGTSGVQLGWLASQADMLAEDWVFV